MNRRISKTNRQHARAAKCGQYRMEQKLNALVSENHDDAEKSNDAIWSQFSVTDSGLNAFIISEFQVAPKAEKNKTIAWPQVDVDKKQPEFVVKEERESLRRSR